jgi:hypothetical protein
MTYLASTTNTLVSFILMAKPPLLFRYLLTQIGVGYPTNVYDCNRLSLSIQGQKMVQSCGLMFIDLPDGCCYGD